MSASVTVEEVNRLIVQASAAFGAFHTRRGLSTSTKLEVYYAVIIPSLFHRVFDYLLSLCQTDKFLSHASFVQDTCTVV